MNKPRIAFFGTPWIASQCLETLKQLDVELVAIVCQPDKQKDRKQNFVFCDVKKFALSHKVPLFQTEKVDQIFDQLAELKLDLIITCAFGQFVSQRILDLPKLKCINLHASLLPKLRGGAPIHWAILNQEKETGITIMYMARKMDAGDIIVQQSLPISTMETYDSLLIKLAQLAQNMLIQYLQSIIHQKLVATPQNESQITLGYNITKAQEIINFHADVASLDAQVRGLYSKPMAKLIYEGQLYKVHTALPTSVTSKTKPGMINRIDRTGMYISTLDFDLQITKIQPPSKQAILISDMINGHHDFKIDTICQSTMETKE